jgi:transposase
MTQRTISMRTIKELLRLQASGLNQRQIAGSLNISLGVVHKYLHLALEAGVGWPLPDTMDEGSLRAALFKQSPPGKPLKYVAPECEWIHKELKHKGVTLQLLHEEYKNQHPAEHYRYTQFCHIYNQWKKKQGLSLRQVHKGGESMFIDYAGPTVTILDPQSGQGHEAAIFIAVLGASNYTYEEATWDQTLANWIDQATSFL